MTGVAARAGDIRGAGASGVKCAHCTLPVPAGLVEPGVTDQFCCEACRTVFAVIHSCGLDRYYMLRDAFDDAPAKAHSTGARYEAFDAPEFLDAHSAIRRDGLREIEFYLDGVHCAACVWLVEKLPEIRAGVVSARLDLARSIVRVVWDGSAAELSAIARDLDRLGYPPNPARGADARARRTREDRRFLVRIAVAGALAGNVMLLAVALYSGLLDSIEAPIETLFRWTSAALGGVALVWPGSVFFRNAIAAARVRAWSLDAPISIALALGGAAGVVNVIRGAGEIYFDSIAMLVFLLLVGRGLQRSQQRRAAERVDRLYTLTPATVTLIVGDEERDAPIEAVTPGMILLVRAGGTVPVDGVVVRGETDIENAVITGESRPVRRTPGDAVNAGAVNVSAPVRVRADAVGDATRLGRIMREVESAASAGSRVTALVDRFSGWFLAAVLTLAAVTLAIWWRSDPGAAIEHTIALLIVTCPCALGLATPLAMTVALGRASREGVFIKSGDAVESLARPGLLLLDKTGTLTEGAVRVAAWSGDETLRPIVAALEAGSNHPVARALTAGFEGNINSDVREIRHIPGLGVTGVVGAARIAAGSHEFISSRSAIPEWAEDARREALAAGRTPILIEKEGVVEAVAALGDRVRSDARESLAALRARGWRIGIVSGDESGIVGSVADELGGKFEMRVGAATPEQKRAIVEREMRGGPVVFVGDGVNDAPALAAASVGVAVHGGAEASLAAADVYLTSAGLTPIVDLVAGADRAMGVVRRNVAASLSYNVVAASLAVGGMVSPLLGAVLMPLSSLTVLSLSLGARTFGVGRRR